MSTAAGSDASSYGEEQQLLLNRAKRAARKGDFRKAMLTIREVCWADRSDARLWVMYGVACYRARKRSDAVEALRQALWLRERKHDQARARVIRSLIDRVENATLGDRHAA